MIKMNIEPRLWCGASRLAWLSSLFLVVTVINAAFAIWLGAFTGVNLGLIVGLVVFTAVKNIIQDRQFWRQVALTQSAIDLNSKLLSR